ncbi:class I SAM-dependent methyltransferase [Pseudonocardia phyllosphaerae]|uniref:class I SAM-dependent methyltransferase n=1 Tax=Pseudonocardia phyllosphaerae TaxID=3390502 RepID=UPI00397BC4C4
MRSLDDQWDITSSVGATALAVAAGRATESRRDDALVTDPLAEAFVAAAGNRALATRSDDDADWKIQSGYMAVRSRFFDEALLAAADTGVRQVVLLAAGLDVRALRLDWPSGTTVYEVDQPQVLDFKQQVISEQGAAVPPGTRRTAVAVDLRHDWPAALREAGFDPAQPTAWLAEGLLPYLPPEAEELLFDRVQELSAPGSRIAVEHFGDCVDRIAEHPRFRSLTETFIGTDIRALFFDGERPESPDARLARMGWTVESTDAATLGARYGRPLHPDLTETFGLAELLSADLPG